MRRLLIRMWVPIFALACCGHWAFGQSLCEFVMPESTIGSAELSFAYRHYDDGRTPGIDSSSGWFATRFERIHDSPTLGYTLWTDTQLGIDTWVATSWLGTGSMSYRYYVSDEFPLFVYAGGRVDAATYYVQPSCEVRSGVGVGRFRDVTPLAKTFRIINALLRSESIKRALSSQVTIQIANQIAREKEYESFEDYVADVAERIGSAVGVPLDSAVILAVRTELEKEETERYCGAILQGGVGYELVDPYGGPRDVLYVMSADVGRALTPDSQLRCRMSWSGASEDFLGENTSTLDVLYSAELPDSNEVRAEYSVSRDAIGPGESVTSQRATVEYTLDWKPADLVLGLTLSKESGDPEWTVDVSISMAIDLL
jgi:hypothetical protein